MDPADPVSAGDRSGSGPSELPETRAGDAPRSLPSSGRPAGRVALAVVLATVGVLLTGDDELDELATSDPATTSTVPPATTSASSSTVGAAPAEPAQPQHVGSDATLERNDRAVSAKRPFDHGERNWRRLGAVTARCADCGKPFGMARRPVRTATGREVCGPCRDRTTAAAAGVTANPEGPVAGAIATEGWLRRLRRRRRRPPT